MKHLRKLICFILVCTLIMATMPAAYAAGLPFTDVPEGKWYTPYVEYVYENKLMNGTSDTLFAPGSTMTRAMAVTVLYRIAGEPKPNSNNPFTDVVAGKYYYNAVLWAVESGITNGTSATTFSPNDNVTREQLVTFLFRTAGKPESNYVLDEFDDYETISSYARSAFAWAVPCGIITGTDDTHISPKTEATRAQCATILTRFVQTSDGPEIYVSDTSLYLTDYPQELVATLYNWDIIEFDILDETIVDCEWGEFYDNSINLTVYPLKSGTTEIYVYPSGTDQIITITVTVDMPSDPVPGQYSAVGTYLGEEDMLFFYEDGTLCWNSLSNFDDDPNNDYYTVYGYWTQQGNDITFSLWDEENEFDNPYYGTVYEDGIDFAGIYHQRVEDPEIYLSVDSLTLTNSPKEIQITLPNWDYISFDFEKEGIVDFQWGEWNGNTVTLILYPVQSGTTYIYFNGGGSETIISIPVTVNMY